LEAKTKGISKKGAKAAHTPLSQGSPPGAVLRASGDGTEKCNGWYKQFGTFNSKPTYFKASDLNTNLLESILLTY
jgi:hypothetical protein